MRTEQAKARRRAQQTEAPDKGAASKDQDHGRPGARESDARRAEERFAAPPAIRPVRSASPLLVPESSHSPEIHFGVLLRRARERRGLTQQDVVRVTRIAERWLPALEEARLDLLPAPVFVAGYVRSYARLVGLDENDLVYRYHALVQQRASQHAVDEILESPPMELPARRRLVVALSCTALILVCLAILWALLR